MRALNSLLAVLVTVALFALAMEGGLRLIGRGPAVTLNRYDPVTGWSKVPGLEARRRTSEYTVDFAFNALGLREDAGVTPETLAPETLRVLCLGDSFVLGFGVQRQDHFVDLLEAALRATGRPAEVVNVGTEGWSTDQQVAWLETYGAAWSPDLVLLLPYENDLFWNTQEQYLRFPKPRYGEDGMREPRPLADPGPRPLRDRSALLGLLPGGGAGPPLIEVEGHTLLAEHGVLLKGGGPQHDEITARTRGCMRAVARWSTAEDTPVTVVPLPSHSAIEERYASEVFGPRVLDGLARSAWDPERPLELLFTLAAEAGLPTHDLRPALEASLASGGRPYHEVDWHFSPEGSRVVARSLLEAVDASGALPPATGTVPEVLATAASPNGRPTWPLWYLALTLGLATAYRRAYPDESTPRAALQVAGLLALVFTVALGGSALLALLPPAAASLLGATLLAALLGFCAWKLGDRLGTITELVTAFVRRGHWYLMPLVVVLLTVGSLLVVAASSPLVAPFIYTLF